jgi:TrmH family RNA methyltransferase
MISKNKIKFIRSLESKKERYAAKLFVVEGEKIIEEILKSDLKVEEIFALDSWLNANEWLWTSKKAMVTSATPQEIEKISFLKSPQPVVCLVKLPESIFSLSQFEGQLSLLLDRIQDPGNLGTIIRIADWFGIENIICTPDSADAFNPKVVQATMGAICRIKVSYQDFASLLPEISKTGSAIYGATLEGENIYNTSLKSSGFIMMGNESNGIAEEWRPFLTQQLFLPNYPAGAKRSESLNVAIATSLICGEFRRRML